MLKYLTLLKFGNVNNLLLLIEAKCPHNNIIFKVAARGLVIETIGWLIRNDFPLKNLNSNGGETQDENFE